MGRLGKLWPEESELIQLVREAQRGGAGALDALLARLRPSFVAYFAPTVGWDDAEDAAQTALLSIVRQGQTAIQSALASIGSLYEDGLFMSNLFAYLDIGTGGELPRHDASLLSNSPKMSNGPSRQTGTPTTTT